MMSPSFGQNTSGTRIKKKTLPRTITSEKVGNNPHRQTTDTASNGKKCKKRMETKAKRVPGPNQTIDREKKEKKVGSEKKC